MLPALTTPRFSWPAFGSASLLRREVDDLFGRLFGDSWGDRDGGMIRGWQVPLSIWDDEQSIYIDAELPGVSQDDVEVIVQDGSLRLRGERKLPNEDRAYWYNERTFGQFERVISLSEMVDPDNIEATMHGGVLSIKLMKRPEARRKKVLIKSE
jgi:HSP20 family protein